MSARATTDTEWSDAEELSTHRAVLFKKCVEAGAQACARGDFQKAVRLYEDAIELDPTNHVLYSNRSAIYCKLGKFDLALIDAVKSYELKPSWNKALYRKGYALKCMGQYVQALLAYSTGLAQDPKNRQLLSGLIECLQQCPLKERFSNVYDELKSLGYDKNAFVLISVVGQELLGVGNTNEAVEILENALKIDTTNLELKQSVLSALSSAYWTLGLMKKALHVMEQDLSIALSLGNVTSESRARSNLGMVHLAVGNLNEALNNYRHHLMLSLRANDKRSAAFTLSTMGQIYMRLFDYKNSLASFEQCLDLMNDVAPVDFVDVYRQYGHMGDVYLSMGREKDAERMYDNHLTSAKRDGNVGEEARALMELGSLWQYRGNMENAGRQFLSAHKLSRQCRDRTLEMHLCGHLCQICSSLRSFNAARRWSEKQLQLALVLRDAVGESKACSNLGYVEFQRGNVENAKKIFQRQLDVAKSTCGGGDKSLLLKAYRNLGLCNEHLKLIRDAIECHTIELSLAKETNDKTSECVAHGYLAALHQSIAADDQTASTIAETHLQCHWALAKESDNAKTESLALRNVGKFYSKSESYERSVEYFEKFLMLAQERNDVDAEKEACRELGIVHRTTGRYREAVRYFDQELALAKDLRDHRTMARAYCDLGLARAALNEFDEAMECQKYFLALAHISHESEMKLQALHNIGDVLLKRNKYGVALKIFCKQLNLAKVCKLRSYEAMAYGKIGESYDFLNKFDRSRQCYGEQLRIARDVDDVGQQFDSYGRLADHFRRQKNVASAVHAYENQIELARTSKNVDGELAALKNLCDLCRDSNMFDDATRYLQERVKLLSKSTSPRHCTSFKRALFDLATCYQSTDNVVDALKIYDENLTTMKSTDDDIEMAACMREYGRLWFKVGNFKRADECFSISYDLLQSTRGGDPCKLCDARLDSICCDVALKQFDLAVEKTKDVLNFCRKISLVRCEIQILLAYARVLLLVDDAAAAMNVAKEALALSRRVDDVEFQCSCMSFFGRMKIFDDDLFGARTYFQQIFDISTKRNVDKWKIYGLKCLASIALASRDFDLSRNLLNQAINFAVSSNDLTSEVEIRINLSLLFWSQRRLTEAKNELENGLKIIEKRSFYLNVDTFLDVGDAPSRLAETLCLLLMILLSTMKLEDDILLIAEKCRYFQCVNIFENVAVDGRKRINLVPSRESIEERLNFFASCHVFYYFRIENYIFSWNFNNGSKLFNVRSVCENENFSSSNGFLTFSNEIMRKISSDLIHSSFLSIQHRSVTPTTFADCVSNDINGRHDSDRLVLIGVDEATNFIRCSSSSTIVYDFALTNFSSKLQTIPSQMLTSGVVIDSSESSKSTSAAATELNVDVIRSSAILKNEFLSKLSKCRCIHLNLKINSTFDGFVLKNNFESNRDCDSDDDADDEHEENDEQIFSTTDVLKIAVRACVAVISVDGGADDCKILPFLTKFAACLTFSGCKSVLFIRTRHSDDVRSIFFHRFYELLTKKETVRSASIDACRQSNVRCDDVLIYGNFDAVLDQVFAQTSRPFHMLLQTPDECREAMLVVLHLVEKSLQRINAGLTTPMFTSEQSVKNKAGPEVTGVFELLDALGFHREISRTTKNVATDESGLYFPLNDASGCLSRGSFVLQAFLSLPQGMYVAFSKLTRANVSIVPLLQMLETIGKEICSIQKIHKFEIKLKRAVYSIAGAAELFAALGFDKLKEDENETTLETIRIELTNKKLQNTLICFHAVFDDIIQRLSPVETSADGDRFERSATNVGRQSVSNFQLNNFKSRDFEMPTDLSGVDSDFPLDESLWAMSLERPKAKSKHHHRPGKWKKSNSKNLSGYLSEGDLKGKKLFDVRCSSRGYHSEDENKPSRSLSTPKRDDSTTSALDFGVETTAQVISVDERSSPFNDLGFHDDAADDLPMAPPLPSMPPASPPASAPPPVPYKHHEYARLETPLPYAQIRQTSPNSSVSPFKNGYLRESTPSSNSCRSSPISPPTASSHGRLRPPSTRPPPPPYDLRLRNKPYVANASSPLMFNNTSPTSTFNNMRPIATTPTPLEPSSDADVMRRAAQKLVFQRQAGPNSSFNGNKRNSTSSSSSPYNVPNDHIVVIPTDNRVLLTNGSHFGALPIFNNHNIHENRVILARDDSFPAEFI